MFRIGCLLSVFLLVPALLPADDEPGLVATAPAEGRSVKSDRGFLVAYKATIPGTKVEFTMVPIPGGKFLMGSPDSEKGREPVEGPRFEVEVPPFWMGQYEITWAEYKAYMSLYDVFKKFSLQRIRAVNDNNKVDAITAPTALYDPSFTFEKGEDPRQPAVTMTQYSAKQYTKWLSALTGQFYRLPSEAEWEYACRAGSQTAYHFGNDPAQIGEYAWYYDNSGETSHPVGLKKPNPWGLYDMHGNVGEWTLDQLLDDGYQRFAGKPTKAQDAIVWPTKLFPRVIRGGSWDDDVAKCRAAYRMRSQDPKWKSEDPNVPLSPWWFTSDPSRGVGFRIVRQFEPATAEFKAKVWEPDVESIRDDLENRLGEGRGAIGIVDKSLPAAIEALKLKK